MTKIPPDDVLGSLYILRIRESDQLHPAFPLQEEGQSRGAESPERGPVSTRKTSFSWSTTTFELLVYTMQCWIMLICSLLLFLVIFFRNSIQNGTKFHCLCQKISSDDTLESLYKLRIRESAQLKTVLELHDMEIHQKISMLNYQKLKTMEKRSIDQKLRLRNFDAREGRIETEAVVKNRKGMSCVEGGKGTCTSGKEKASVRDQCSLRHESNDRAQKPDHNAATPSEPPCHEVKLCRRKEVFKAKITLVPFFDDCADVIWKVLARERLVNIDIRPSAGFFFEKKKGNRLYGWRRSAQNERRDIFGALAVLSGYRMVGGFHGLSLLSAKHSRSLVWWEDTMWKAVRNAPWRTSNTVWSNGRLSPCFCERPI